MRRCARYQAFCAEEPARGATRVLGNRPQKQNMDPLQDIDTTEKHYTAPLTSSSAFIHVPGCLFQNHVVLHPVLRTKSITVF